ncbi:hypothetical protein ACFXNW_28875 [Nocardia sp. NPDC059180]|uniref:hypothetical protein n=1 Tax=Nocardia sp. NPDC059180 TaxID=3346761 RepID=UPI003676C0D8
MSRRRYRRDPVGDHVADKSLAVDLEAAWAALPEDDREFVFDLLEELEHTPAAAEKNYKMIGWVSGAIRVNPVHQVRLLAYLGRMPKGRCWWCIRELKPREPGKAGRPARYCSPNHRQQGCRSRRRLDNLARARKARDW